jgi:hypothetical protein
MTPHGGKWIPWALNWFLTIGGAGLVLSSICLLVSPDSVFLLSTTAPRATAALNTGWSMTGPKAATGDRPEGTMPSFRMIAVCGGANTVSRSRRYARSSRSLPSRCNRTGVMPCLARNGARSRSLAHCFRVRSPPPRSRNDVVRRSICVSARSFSQPARRHPPHSAASSRWRRTRPKSGWCGHSRQ